MLWEIVRLVFGVRAILTREQAAEIAKRSIDLLNVTSSEPIFISDLIYSINVYFKLITPDENGNDCLCVVISVTTGEVEMSGKVHIRQP